ncbi:hypothetical protein [Flavobacterium beibuense]|uniref:hypothetical protein n=1 Tax=Flavobacterium beibuense TaxID=657326 RepID=UPI003A907610
MALTRQTAKVQVKQLLDSHSNNPEITPEEARQEFADTIVDIVFDCFIGRTTQVNGVSSDGATVTGTGIIQET